MSFSVGSKNLQFVGSKKSHYSGSDSWISFKQLLEHWIRKGSHSWRKWSDSLQEILHCLTEKWFSICDQEWDFIRVVSMANLVTFSEMKVYWWQRHYLSGLLFSLVCKQPLHCQETFNFQEDQTKWSLDCNRKDRHSLTSCGRS